MILEIVAWDAVTTSVLAGDFVQDVGVAVLRVLDHTLAELGVGVENPSVACMVDT